MPCACTCAQVVHRHRAPHGTPRTLVCRPIDDYPALVHHMLVIVSLTSAVRGVRLRRIHCSRRDDYWSLSVCRDIPHQYRPAQCKNAREQACLPPVHSLFLAHRACGARSESCARSDDMCARVPRGSGLSLSSRPFLAREPSTCKRTGFNWPLCGREQPSNVHPLSPHACCTRACVAS